MVKPSDYAQVKAEQWRIRALAQAWDASLQARVLALVRAQVTSRHPQTIELWDNIESQEKSYFLKVFHRVTLISLVKDQLRHGPAMGSWRQGLALAAAGFNAPMAIAAGEEAGWRMPRREFLLTAKIDGAPLLHYLQAEGAGSLASVPRKRHHIKSLARLIRRFHQVGFVHGDLVPTNIYVATCNPADLEFVFMDNDRTKQYPGLVRQSLWKRNLIQLNRMPLPGISLQDRMRFLLAYLNVKRLTGADRRFARWLEVKTRQRRYECDGADPTISFRRLMRWAPEMAGAKHV